jgi:hypothetical protein
MDMKEVNAALAIIKESEQLIVGLKVSIGSPSSELSLIENGVVPYLKSRKRALRIRFFQLAFKAVWAIIIWKKRSRNC